MSRLVGEILPRCKNTAFFSISVFDVLPNKIHYGCSFAFPAGFVIISPDIYRNNEIKINFNGEVLTFFVILLSPEGLKYNKLLTKSTHLTVHIHDCIINIIVLIKNIVKIQFCLIKFISLFTQFCFIVRTSNFGFLHIIHNFQV